MSAVTTASKLHDPAATVLPAAPLGRSLSDGGRPSGEVILCSILQMTNSSGGQPRAFSRGRLPRSQAKRAADRAHTTMVRHLRCSAAPPVLKNAPRED